MNDNTSAVRNDVRNSEVIPGPLVQPSKREPKGQLVCYTGGADNSRGLLLLYYLSFVTQDFFKLELLIFRFDSLVENQQSTPTPDRRGDQDVFEPVPAKMLRIIEPHASVTFAYATAAELSAAPANVVENLHIGVINDPESSLFCPQTEINIFAIHEKALVR